MSGSTLLGNWSNWTQTGGYATTVNQSTTGIWVLHADAHDFRSQSLRVPNLAARIFATHFGHLSIVLAWLSASLFAGGRFSNYEAWLANPVACQPAAQVVYNASPVLQDVLNADVGSGLTGIRITSGLFSVWRSWGICSSTQLFTCSLVGLLLATACLLAGWFHLHQAMPRQSWFNDVDAMLNHHLAALLGCGSLAWSGHLIHVSGPVDRLLTLGVDPGSIPAPSLSMAGSLGGEIGLTTAAKVFALDWKALAFTLTLNGSLNAETQSLWLSDIAHHHVAIGVLAFIAGHLYRTQFGIGVPIETILSAHRTQLRNSWHLQLAINLGALGTVSILVGHLLQAVPSYPFLVGDLATVLSLFTHHAWIGGFFIVGSAAHAAIFAVYDYRILSMSAFDRVLCQKHAIISHLNWVCIFLGFHSFGLYIHNDTLSALGRMDDLFSDTSLALRPVVALWAQSALGVEAWRSGSIAAGRILGLGTSDTLVHHVHAFTIHVTTLILLKGVLFARSSRLVADKSTLGFRFPCDGPGRGGTCQSSSWDHVFLGLFWMYNAVSVVIFHYSWKLQSDALGTIQGTGAKYITDGNFATGGLTSLLGAHLQSFLGLYRSHKDVASV